MESNYKVYKPNCAANATDKYLVEIRQKGWLIDYKRFDNEGDAIFFGQTYCGNAIAPKVIPLYERMIWMN